MHWFGYRCAVYVWKPILIEFREEWYTPEMLRAEPDKIFVFGDNTKRVGKGGQAIIRDEPNALGVVTKWYGNNYPQAFMKDDEYLLNVNTIISDLQVVESYLRAGHTVVWPKDGIGTGRARLSTEAPKTYLFITGTLTYFCNKYGVVNKFEEKAKIV